MTIIVNTARVNQVVYCVQHGCNLNMFAEQKEFVGSGAKQKAAAYAADRAKAGLLSTEFPIEVYRAQFDRNGCLKGQSVVVSYKIGG